MPYHDTPAASRKFGRYHALLSSMGEPRRVGSSTYARQLVSPRTAQRRVATYGPSPRMYVPGPVETDLT